MSFIASVGKEICTSLSLFGIIKRSIAMLLLWLYSPQCKQQNLKIEERKQRKYRTNSKLNNARNINM